MALKDVPVSTKLILGFTVVLAATIALGAFTVERMSEVNAKAAEIRENWLPATRALAKFQYSTTRYRSFSATYIQPISEAQRRVHDQTFAKLKQDAAQALRTYTELSANDPDEAAFARRIAETWAAYLPMLDREVAIYKSQGEAAATVFLTTESRRLFNEMNDTVDAAIVYTAKQGDAAARSGHATYDGARMWAIGAVALAALFCLGACVVLIGAVSAPLQKMTSAMGELAAGRLDAHVPHAEQNDEIGKLAASMTAFKDQLAAAERSKAEQTEIIVSSIGAGLDYLAKGDLTHRVSAELQGPFAKLKRDFNEAMTRLQDTLKNVLSTTGQITNGAGEISQAADDLSRRTEQQAASLEETAAALEEITATVKRTAANSKEASVAVQSAKKAAGNGGSVVESAIHAMDSIAQSSKQITDIIGVIDEIAFQTNLLALNAGVEAARAGEAGKGFAVVASEVRALAQRSSEAAKQIKALIHTSGDHVGTGVKLVGESGEALKQIVSEVEQINSLVFEMAQAAEQQSSGIQEVNAAVSQMDQVTQQNAAMVEQSTAASRNLAGETRTLQNLVAFFNVGAQAPVSRERAAPPARKAPQPVAARRSSAAVAQAVAPAPAKDAEDWAEF